MTPLMPKTLVYTCRFCNKQYLNEKAYYNHINKCKMTNLIYKKEIDNKCKHRIKGICELDDERCPKNFKCDDYETK